MRDDLGHEFERWGTCRRCGADSGDLAATEPCPGDSRAFAALVEGRRPPPNGPSARRRRVEDLALVDYVLTVIGAVGDEMALAAAEAFNADPQRAAGILLDHYTRRVEPADVEWPDA